MRKCSPSPSEEVGRKNRFALKPVNNNEGACGAFGAAGASADVWETFLGVCSFLAPSVVVAWAERGTLYCFEVSVNVLRCVFFERTTMRSQWGSTAAAAAAATAATAAAAAAAAAVDHLHSCARNSSCHRCLVFERETTKALGRLKMTAFE
jgi:hypothetical protein